MVFWLDDAKNVLSVNVQKKYVFWTKHYENQAKGYKKQTLSNYGDVPKTRIPNAQHKFQYPQPHLNLKMREFRKFSFVFR